MRIVSSIVSPFTADDEALAFSTERMAPPSLIIAASNDRRVRVLGS